MGRSISVLGGIALIILGIIVVLSRDNNLADVQNGDLGYTSESNFTSNETTTMDDSVKGATTNQAKLNKYSQAPEILPEAERVAKKSILKTDKGTIEIELFGDEAPLAVSNHIFLVNDDFYDGLIFHRREEGFVIQGGDPLGQGYGGPGYQFEDEPVTRSYTRGIVAMANSGPDTNGSQFFIMLSDSQLPPAYTIFGEVISGMDVVDQIEVGDKIIEATIAPINY